MDAVEPFVIRNYLLFFLFPAWNAIGILDWWCHRRAGIERFGLYEPALHLGLLALAGGPILLGLFFEINSPILLLMVLCLVAHEAVSYIDVAWATRVRGIPPFEQRLHDYLAALPFAALSLVIVLHWESAISLIRNPIASLVQEVHLRSPQFPTEIITAVFAIVLICNIVPFVEEFFRAVRHRRGSRLAHR